MPDGPPIPVLRFEDARRADGTFSPEFLDRLRTALHEVGFLHLTDYGAAPRLLRELRAAATRFFDLPVERRLEIDNRRSPHFRGYTRLGHEITAGHADAREQIDFGPEHEPLPRGLWDAPFRLLEGPNQWPDADVPELRGLVAEWTTLLSGVATGLTRAIAASLGLPEHHFDPAFADAPHWFGKVIRYVGAPDGADVQGVGPHADWGFLTLLLQDGSGGLQARPPHAAGWVDVDPIEDALVVNIGEMLEIATRGYLVATAHRVLPCAPGATRESIGFFWSPRLDAALDRVPLPRALAAEAPGVSVSPDNALLPRFGDNALKGWLRSHPEVAAVHHPELVVTSSC